VTNAPKPATRATLPVSHWSDEMPSKADRSAGGRAAWVLSPKPAFMDKDILPLSRSTLWIRTLTLCPGSTMLDTSSTKPSASCEMWTRPSALSPVGSVTDTKAPKDAIFRTVPSSQSSDEMASKAVKSAGFLGPPPPSSRPSIIVSPNLPSSRNPLIQTSTSCPSSK